MDNSHITELKNGLHTAFIDSTWNSDLAYRPEFISNDYRQGKKVLSKIDKELEHCEEFCISAAFINMGGVEPLLQTLRDLDERGIPGKVLTTDYLTFTEPKALDKLTEFQNIQLKLFRVDTDKAGFHTKGYIFRRDVMYRIIIGSSNMTQAAITRNREWNTKIVGLRDGEVVRDILNEFLDLWNSKSAQNYEDCIEDYRVRYRSAQKQKQLARQNAVVSLEQYTLKPNQMQAAFTARLRQLLRHGEQRALLISSTGTGKTLASAFGIRDAIMEAIGSRHFRVLFLVHREQIARQAMDSYKKVFGTQKTYGLLSGRKHDIHADFLFSTVQTLSKPENLQSFSPEDFSVLVVDEVHHAGAATYQRVMNYFHPQFFLGMTATPERTDGYDIYQLFDHNIAYEIRLQQAMEEDLLCPFHYFGITDIAFEENLTEKEIKTVDSQVSRGDYRVFNRLTADRRVDYILEQASFYGWSGDRVKGLIFVSTKRVGKEISEKMNRRGLRTLFLSGEDSQDVRDTAIERLTSDTIAPEKQLDYIISVDIFGEGSDIPEINQILMLRPTESAIVFVQQLGRGLRKSAGKEYLVVLDFIGNYNNNFLIPIALSGDRTYNKDNMRKYVMEGSSVIPGSSTIHFDRIAKQRIFDSINRASTKRAFLKEKYQNLKNKLGHIPSIPEFYQFGEIDPILILEYSKTYETFLRTVDPDYKVRFTQAQEATLQFISASLASGKRPHELLMIQMLTDHETMSAKSFAERLHQYQVKFRMADYQSTLRVLNKQFMNTQTEKKNFAPVHFFADKAPSYVIEPEPSATDSDHSMIRRAASFAEAMKNAAYKKALTDLLAYGMQRYQDYYADADEDNLVLYQKYSRKDVCRILNWERDDSQTMYGYRIKYNTCPIFVTYEKDEDIAESTKYEDRFVSNRRFSWMTRSRVSTNSTEAQELIHQKDNGLKIYLFVKKSNGEGTDFYYMGKCRQEGYQETTIKNDKGQVLPIMNFQLRLEHPVRNDIYDYFEG